MVPTFSLVLRQVTGVLITSLPGKSPQEAACQWDTSTGWTQPCEQGILHSFWCATQMLHGHKAVTSGSEPGDLQPPHATDCWNGSPAQHWGSSPGMQLLPAHLPHAQACEPFSLGWETGAA